MSYVHVVSKFDEPVRVTSKNAVSSFAATVLFATVKLIFAAGTCKFNCVAFEVNVASPGLDKLIFTATLLFKLTLNVPNYANEATLIIIINNTVVNTGSDFVILLLTIISPNSL